MANDGSLACQAAASAQCVGASEVDVSSRQLTHFENRYLQSIARARARARQPCASFDLRLGFSQALFVQLVFEVCEPIKSQANYCPLIASRESASNGQCEHPVHYALPR